MAFILSCTIFLRQGMLEFSWEIYINFSEYFSFIIVQLILFSKKTSIPDAVHEFGIYMFLRHMADVELLT